MRFFTWLGLVPFTAGFLLGLRWVYFLYAEPTRTRIPSLILTCQHTEAEREDLSLPTSHYFAKRFRVLTRREFDKLFVRKG